MKNRLTYCVKCARPGIALALAYAFAMQVLLASVVAAGLAGTPQAETAIICYGSADGTGQQPHSPAHLADCALACAQGFSAAAILPDVPSFLVFAAGDTIKGAHLATLDLSPRPSPKLSQGPPQIA